MMTERFPELAKLSPAEKWQVIIELEDELIDDVTLEEPLKSELSSLFESRMADFRENPQSAMSLDEARERLRNWKTGNSSVDA